MTASDPSQTGTGQTGIGQNGAGQSGTGADHARVGATTSGHSQPVRRPGPSAHGAARSSHHEPIFNMPGSVLALIVAFAAVQAVRAMLPDETANRLTVALAFVPARYSGLADELPGGTLACYTSFLTHAFVHGDLGHLAINSMWIAAFGSAIARRTGTLRFLAFFALCAIAGAAAFLAFNVGLLAPMVGASGAISGMMGAAMRFLFRGLEEGGITMLRDRPRQIPLMTVAEALRDRRVLSTTGIWLGVNLLALLGLGGLGGGGQIAWEAHIGGYAAGLLTYGLFDRGARRAAPKAPDGSGAPSV